MTRAVVDASVAAKCFFPDEVHADSAYRLLAALETTIVPDLLYLELCNVLWKRVRSGTISREEATRFVAEVETVPTLFEAHDARHLMSAALEIACETEASVYDSAYLALAIREGVPCITSDRLFLDKIKSTRVASSIMWIEDV